MLANPQHILWQELTGVIHSSVSGFSGVGLCPNLDCAVSELTLSIGRQTRGVGEDRAEEEHYTPGQLEHVVSEPPRSLALSSSY